MDSVFCMFLLSPVEGRQSELDVHQKWLLWQTSSSQAPPEHKALGLNHISAPNSLRMTLLVVPKNRGVERTSPKLSKE